MQGFLRAHRIALRIHGAVDPENPLNNVLARRQHRKNKAPYIIHPMGIVWACVHIAGILNTRLIEAAMDHDVPEDGLENIALLHPGTSEETAALLIRKEIIETYGQDAGWFLTLLSWFVRGVRSYREYIDRFKTAPLDVVLLKLIDQANNLCDIPYLMSRGHDDRARRQVGKTLRYFSELIQLEPFKDDPRYRNTVLYLMKTLITVSQTVKWFEPYYERQSGSNLPSEDQNAANAEVLQSINQIHNWLEQPWVRLAMGKRQGSWGPPVDLNLLHLFVDRMDKVSERIRQRSALPRSYTNPKSWESRGFTSETYWLKVSFTGEEKHEQLPQARKKIDEAIQILSTLKEGEFIVGTQAGSSQIAIKVPLHLPLGGDRMTIGFAFMDQLSPLLKGLDVQLTPMSRLGSSVDGENTPAIRLATQGDLPAMSRFFRVIFPGRGLSRFQSTLKKIFAKEVGGFSLLVEESGKLVGMITASVRYPHKIEISRLGVAEEVQGRGIGEDLVDFAVELARAFPQVDTVIANTPPDSIGESLLLNRGFRIVSESRLFNYLTFSLRRGVSNDASNSRVPQSLTGTWRGPAMYGFVMPFIEEGLRVLAGGHIDGLWGTAILVLFYSSLHAGLHVFVDYREGSEKGGHEAGRKLVRELIRRRLWLSIAFGFTSAATLGVADYFHLAHPLLWAWGGGFVAHAFNNWIWHFGLTKTLLMSAA